jgi:hypothetical protein
MKLKSRQLMSQDQRSLGYALWNQSCILYKIQRLLLRPHMRCNLLNQLTEAEKPTDIARPLLLYRHLLPLY